MIDKIIKWFADYDEVVKVIDDKYKIVVKRGTNGEKDKYGVVDNDNNEIIPIKYDRIVYSPNDLTYALKDSEIGAYQL